MDIDRAVMDISGTSIGCADAPEIPTACLSAKRTSAVDLTGNSECVVFSTRGPFHNGTAMRSTMIGGLLVARFDIALG